MQPIQHHHPRTQQHDPETAARTRSGESGIYAPYLCHCGSPKCAHVFNMHHSRWQGLADACSATASVQVKQTKACPCVFAVWAKDQHEPAPCCLASQCLTDVMVDCTYCIQVS